MYQRVSAPTICMIEDVRPSDRAIMGAAAVSGSAVFAHLLCVCVCVCYSDLKRLLSKPELSSDRQDTLVFYSPWSLLNLQLTLTYEAEKWTFYHFKSKDCPVSLRFNLFM